MLLRNKFILTFFIFIILISPLIYAQMCEVAHVRNNLRKMLYEYFESPSTAKVELGKVKDILNFYLTIPPEEDNVDCSGIGANSGVSYYIIVLEADNITTAIPYCSDGTEFGACSDTKPSYCYNGRLIDRCSTCGCISTETCQTDNSCVELTNITNQTQPPPTNITNQTQLPPTNITNQTICSDGTPYSKCSITKPKYCGNGTLVDNCGICGCDVSQGCQEDGTCQTWMLGDASSNSESLSEWRMFGRTLDNNRYYSGTVDMTNFGLLWSYETKGGISYSSPAIANGKMYIGDYDGNLYALNAETGELVWDNYISRRIEYSSPAVANGIVYIAEGMSGNLYALNAETGEEIWYNSSLGDMESSPAVADGIVYAGSSSTFPLYALNAETGAEIWNFMPYCGIYSSVAIVSGVVYTGGYCQDVYALNAKTGEIIWSHIIGGAVNWAAPAIANGVVYIGSEDKNLYALDAETGEEIWKYTTSSYIYSSPAVANGIVYIGNYGGNLYALNAETGAEIWKYATGGSLYSSPAVTKNGILFIGSYDNNFYALDAETGAEIWKSPIYAIESSPIIANGIVYIGSWDHKVYAFSALP